jgi:hypothetical protein
MSALMSELDRHIGPDEAGALTELLRELLAFVHATTGNDDGRTVLDEELCRSLSNPARGAGDDGDFPVERHRCLLHRLAGGVLFTVTVMCSCPEHMGR